MSAEIATYEKVQAAVAELHRDGQKATANSVIAQIGGGSKPTILKHMKRLREAPQLAEAALPASILDLVKPVLTQIYAQGANAEQLRGRDQTDRLHRHMADLEAEVEQFAAASAIQGARLSELTGKLATTEETLKAAEEIIDRQRRDIMRLQAKLAEENEAATGRLASLLEGFEERFSGLATQLDRPGPTETKIIRAARNTRK